jgi:general secretion pathway protein D
VTLKPQIAEGDHLTLDYSVSLSAFTGAAAGSNVPPPKQQNAVRSVASLPDGHTVAVGGIELATDGDAESRVPILGQIPIIGEAFKNRTKNHGRTRFYVFIRTNIFRNQNFEDLKYLSQQSAQEAGLDDGWPVVQPLIIK